MSIYRFIRYKSNPSWSKPIITLETNFIPGMRSQNMPGNFISELAPSCIKKFLDFLNQVIAEKNEYESFETRACTSLVVKVDGKRMLKIFFHLSDDYEPGYISPEDMKELLEFWIREWEKFEKDPKKYKEEMIRKGAKIIQPQDWPHVTDSFCKNPEQFSCGMVEESVQSEHANEKSSVRDAFTAGSQVDRPWWQFWK